METCTYDNPVSLLREFWEDGRVVASYPASHCVGPYQWRGGCIVGNSKAIQRTGESMSHARETFYVVWRRDGGEPTKRHENLADAEAEAGRLAMENPNHEFIVLKAISGHTHYPRVHQVNYGKRKNG